MTVPGANTSVVKTSSGLVRRDGRPQDLPVTGRHLAAPKIYAPTGTSHLHGTRCGLDAPDHVGILRDGSISGELRHGGGRLDAELAPFRFVRVGCIHLCLGIDEGRKVMHNQVPVAIPGACTVRVAKLVNQRAKLGVSLRLTLGELAVANCLENGLQSAVDRVVTLLRLCCNAGNLVLQTAKDEHGVFTTLLTNLNVGAIHGTNNQATVHDKLHIGGSACLRACSGNVLRDVRSWDQDFGCRHAVVRHKCKLQEFASVWVVVDDFANIVDQLDNELCVHIGRCCLATDQDHTLLHLLTLSRRHLLQLLVTVDNIETIHKLPLVLVDALDLDVDKCILIDFKVQRLLQEACELLLGGLLHLHPLGMQLWVLLELQHAFQFRHVRQPLVGAKILCEDCAQGRVSTVHPTAGGHTVGHVHNLVRCAGVAAVLVEVREGFLLDDLCVKRGDAIHLVGTHDGQVAHADLLDVALFKNAQSRDDGPIAVLRHQTINPSEV